MKCCRVIRLMAVPSVSEKENITQSSTTALTASNTSHQLKQETKICSSFQWHFQSTGLVSCHGVCFNHGRKTETNRRGHMTSSLREHHLQRFLFLLESVLRSRSDPAPALPDPQGAPLTLTFPVVPDDTSHSGTLQSNVFDKASRVLSCSSEGRPGRCGTALHSSF